MPTTLTLQPTGQLLTVPTRWADVTYAQFVALHAPEPGEQRTAAELLLGLPAGGLDQLAADDVPFIANLIEFVQDISDVLALLPTPGLPDGVGGLPYGTLVLAQQRMQQEAERPWLSYGAHLLALYRTTMLWGAAVPAKVAACEAALLAAPVTEVYADAAHFSGACRNWLNGTPQTKPTTATKAKRSWRRIPNPRWLSALGRCSP